MNKYPLYFITLFYCSAAIAQQPDSLLLHTDSSATKPQYKLQQTIARMNENRKRLRSVIVPAAMITYGFISLENDALLKLDNSIKEEIWTENPHKPVTIDKVNPQL